MVMTDQNTHVNHQNGGILAEHKYQGKFNHQLNAKKEYSQKSIHKTGWSSQGKRPGESFGYVYVLFKIFQSAI